MPLIMEFCRVLLFCSFLLLVNGARIVRQAEEPTENECMNPPENTEMVSCCEMPNHHLWGNIRQTIHICAAKMKGNGDEGADEGRGEGAALVATSPIAPKGLRGFGRRHFFKHRINDGCFVECIFEREGFLIEGGVNRQALIDRLETSLAEEQDWLEVAKGAVEKCLAKEPEIAANETCQSGSAETLKCIFKEMFMDCPVWLVNNDYCTSLKEFYVKCPNGPPPQVFFRRKFHSRPQTPGAAEEPEGELNPETEDKADS